MSVPAQVVSLAERRSPLARAAAAFRELAEAIAEAIEEMDPRPPQADGTVTIKTAAVALGVSTALVYQQIRKGSMKAIHIGRAVRIPASELEAFRKRRLR
jgi:excisionase family DNA binding protein